MEMYHKYMFYKYIRAALKVINKRKSNFASFCTPVYIFYIPTLFESVLLNLMLQLEGIISTQNKRFPI